MCFFKFNYLIIISFYVDLIEYTIYIINYSNS